MVNLECVDIFGRIKNGIRSKNIIELKETHDGYDLSEDERSKCHRQIRMC